MNHFPNEKREYPYINELHRFFYYNQYDEEKYPHFRCCDEEIEYDHNGNEFKYYIFYLD